VDTREELDIVSRFYCSLRLTSSMSVDEAYQTLVVNYDERMTGKDVWFCSYTLYLDFLCENRFVFLYFLC